MNCEQHPLRQGAHASDEERRGATKGVDPAPATTNIATTSMCVCACPCDGERDSAVDGGADFLIPIFWRPSADNFHNFCFSIGVAWRGVASRGKRRVGKPNQHLYSCVLCINKLSTLHVFCDNHSPLDT